MAKRLFISVVAVLLMASVGLVYAQQKPAAKDTTITGWVTDTSCGAKGTSEKHADCAKKCVKEKGAKYALYDTKSKKLFTLDPQDQGEDHAGHHVKVTGTVDGDTLHVSNIAMVPAKAAADKKGAGY